MHSRSDVVDGVAFSNSLPVHTVTGVQAAPSLAPDHVEPAVHGVHWRFAWAVPAADMPEPAAQVRQGEHACLPSMSLKCAAGHPVQTRSLLRVKGLVKYSPGGHEPALAARQISPLSSGENVVPSSH